MNNLSLVKIVVSTAFLFFGYKLVQYCLKYRDGWGLYITPSVDVEPTLSKFVTPNKANKKSREKLLSEIIFSILWILLLFVFLIGF